MTTLGPSPLAAGERNLSIDEARAAIAAPLRPIDGVQTLALEQALGRVLAEDLVSPIDVPAHDNSAMDGYAFAAAALQAGQTLTLQSIGQVWAGKPFAGGIGARQCLRIMTGAVMPDGADTVVPIELCRVDGEQVHIEAGVIQSGENRRRRGEDLGRGQVALAAGRVLRPADIGLIASLGIERVSVRRALRVALFSTGDEIVPPGQALAPGCVYDSNRASLGAALRRLGCEVVDMGLVRDDPKALEAALRRAAADCDAVLTSGGVSAGDADYTRDVLARLGRVDFWKVAMRPGRPFAFGPIEAEGKRAWLFALPGNPVAALVTFYALAREGLLRLAGAEVQALPLLKARCSAAIRKRPGRTEYQRALLTRASDGSWQAEPFASQGAGILRSMSASQALLVLHHDQASVAAGDWVDLWLFDGLT